jgi:hypothetical protein
MSSADSDTSWFWKKDENCALLDATMNGGLKPGARGRSFWKTIWTGVRENFGGRECGVVRSQAYARLGEVAEDMSFSDTVELLARKGLLKGAGLLSHEMGPTFGGGSGVSGSVVFPDGRLLSSESIQEYVLGLVATSLTPCIGMNPRVPFGLWKLPLSLHARAPS